MAAGNHYRIEATFGPPDLFRLLRALCERPENRRAKMEFEFDWLKRRVALSAENTEALEGASASLIERVAREAAPGQLLLGPRGESDGRVIQPFGVLLQTPDVFLNLIVTTLGEFGAANIRVDEDGCGLTVPASRLNDLMQYDRLLLEFPLPAYLRIVADSGVSPT